MEIISYKKIFFIFILSAAIQLNGQKKFDLSINGISLNLDGKNLVGYSSQFDFTRDEVRKGWWRYAKKFGSPLDMRTFYKVKIPAESTDGNVDLTIYSETIVEQGKTLFKIGLEDEKYKVQVEELMKVFKKDFYIKFYLAELELKKVEAEKYSSQYESAILEDEKMEALDLLNARRQEMERLKQEIRKVEEN